jgi:hypothetical protein
MYQAVIRWLLIPAAWTRRQWVGAFLGLAFFELFAIATLVLVLE